MHRESKANQFRGLQAAIRTSASGVSGLIMASGWLLGPVRDVRAIFVLAIAFSCFSPTIASALWPYNGATVHTGAGTQTPYTANGSTVCADDAGGVISAYRSAASEIRINRLDGSDGTRLWIGSGGILVTDSAGGPPHVVTDLQGGAWVVWYDIRTTGQGTGLYVQHYDALGNTLWANAGGVRIVGAIHGDSSGNRIGVDVTPAGNLVYACGTATGVWVQRILLDRTLDAFAKVANDATMNGIRVAADGEGAVVAWLTFRNAEWGIWANRMSAAGSVLWGTEGKQVMRRVDGGVSSSQFVTDWDGSSLFVAWSFQPTGPRTGLRDLYAQRLDSSGDFHWGSANYGLRVLNAPVTAYSSGLQLHVEPQIVLDGSSGCIIAWRDVRNYNLAGAGGFLHGDDLYGQRLDANGSEFWASNGRVLDESLGDQQEQKMVSDGQSGAILVYTDYLSATKNITALRIDGNGDQIWKVSPCNAGETQQFPVVAPDASGGFVAAWEDERNGVGDVDTYAAHHGSNGTRFVPGLTLTAPNGGERLFAGVTQSILWTSNLGGSVSLAYEPAGGTATAIVPSTSNDGSFSWVVPYGPAPDVRASVSVPSGVLTDESNGTFRMCGPLFVTGTSISGVSLGRGVAIADFDEDGIADLAMGVQTGVSIALGGGSGGIGDGSFGVPTVYPMTGVLTGDVRVFDLDDDGILDLVSTDFDGIGVLMGSGSGGVGNGMFGPVTSYPVTGDPQGLFTGDFDEDGITDVAVAAGGSSVFVARGGGGSGLGDGTFGEFIPYPVASGATRIEGADFNLDGIMDLAVACFGSGNVSILMGAGSAGVGNGTFLLPAVNRAVTNLEEGLALGDFDENGTVDIVTATGSGIAVLAGNGDGSFAAAQYSNGGTTAFDLVAGDFTGDGRLDVIAAEFSSARITVYEGSGAGSIGDGGFSKLASYAVYPSADRVGSGDFNGDGVTDLVVVTQNGAVTFHGDIAGCHDLPTTLTLLIPNGGEVWPLASSQTISWLRDEGVGAVSVEVSRDGGENWELLAENQVGISWTWNVTPPVSSAVRVRVRDSLLPARADASDAVFSVVEYAPFVDASSGPLGDAGGGQGAAWGDYDGDGDLDLYITNANSANKLLRNGGGGAFVDVTSGPLGDTGTSHGAAWGDYDNDGDLDLYLANEGQPNKLLRNDGGGAFVDATSPPLDDGGSGVAVAWGDYDNDGDLDLYLVNVGEANKLLRNDGGGTFVDATSGPLGDTGFGAGTAWGDYDNDGDLDLYLTKLIGANKLFRNDGGGTFVDATSGPLGDSGNSTGVAWGDYDNDGDLDLYFANIYGANKLLRNDGGGVFVDASSAPLNDAGQGWGVAWGDYDNDGDLDLYVANDGQANKLLRNDGGGAFADATISPLGDAGNGQGVAWGDYDGDGDLDLYLANNGQANRLMRNQAAAGRHWLQVKLQGTVSNRTGIGARVTLVAGGVTQIRELSGGSGFASQNAMVAAFGLGSATTVDHLEVAWPSGQVQVVSSALAMDKALAADQVVTVVEFSPFVDATTGPLGGVESSVGVAWGDYDNDGDLDLYVANLGANKLLRNDGAGSFVDATNSPLDDGANSYGAAWGDYDSDGDLDLYITNSGQPNRLFRNDSGTFVDATSGPLGDTGFGRGVAWGDYDSDGDLDLYFANSNSANKLLRNDGNDTFVDATGTTLDDAGLGRGVAWGDYDNDGDLDLYLTNAGQANKLFRNDGGGLFADATGPVLGDTGNGFGAAWGDYDNDGDLDLYLANSGEANKLFRNDGGVFADATSGPLGDGGNGRGAAWGDYDNDGDLDLYVANNGQANLLLRNDGGDTFVDATSAPLDDAGTGQGVAWGDYDNDGDIDLYLANDGSNKLFRNESSTGQHWLQVTLEGNAAKSGGTGARVKAGGAVANLTGIGARVILTAGGLTQVREISGGSGYASQDAMVASFGLGSAMTVDSLIVRWPGGIVQVVDPMSAVDGVLNVVAPSWVADVPDRAVPARTALLGAVPNPFNPSTMLSLDLAESGHVRLRIYDVAGRRVATLMDVQRDAGRHQVVWNGRDSAGRMVAAGVYLYRMEVGSYSETKRMLLVK